MPAQAVPPHHSLTCDGSLYQLCRRLQEIVGHAQSQVGVSMMGRNPQGECMIFRIWYQDKDSSFLIRARPPGQKEYFFSWVADKNQTRTIMPGKKEDRPGVHEWVMPALASAIRIPLAYQTYRYLDESSEIPFIVATLPDGELRVLVDSGCQKPAVPEDLCHLDLEGFWRLFEQKRLVLTTEGLSGAGWIWQATGEKSTFLGNTPMKLLSGVAGRFRGLAPREPLDLCQPEPYSCVPNVVANLRWMYRTSDLQGDAAVAEIDQLTRRKPGKIMYLQTGLLPLLSEGFQLIGMSDFDLERLREEGLSYMKESCGEEWTPELEKYWTPHRIQMCIRSSQVANSRFSRISAPFSAQFVERRQRPLLEDIKLFLGQDYGVVSLISNGVTNGAHAVLLYDQDEHGFAAYYPSERGRTLRYYTHAEFADKWYDDQLWAIKR